MVVHLRVVVRQNSLVDYPSKKQTEVQRIDMGKLQFDLKHFFQSQPSYHNQMSLGNNSFVGIAPTCPRLCGRLNKAP